MCFSAYASFVASGSLAVVGTTALVIAPKKQKLLAIAPMVFSIQQALEGIQWTYLDKGLVCEAAGYGFLFFATVFWPLYFPILVYILDRETRYISKMFIWIGATISLWYSYLLVSSPLIIQAIGKHIFYDPPGAIGATNLAFSIICTTVLLLSKKKALKVVGVAFILAGLVSILVSRMAAASVWCFLSALISLGFLWIIKSGSLNEGRTVSS